MIILPGAELQVPNAGLGYVGAEPGVLALPWWGLVKGCGSSTWLRLSTGLRAGLDQGLGLSETDFHLGFWVWCSLMESPWGYLARKKKKKLNVEISVDAMLSAI